eukprot:358020-Chlamydomonas_euryale.AAC.6
MRFHTTAAATYSVAVRWKTDENEPVASTTKPTAVVPTMPANTPNVLHRPNIFPACRGAMSDMLATKPACPRLVVPSATVIAATARAGVMLGSASSMSAAAGTANATVCRPLRTAVTDTPRDTSASASTPAKLLPAAMTSQGRNDSRLDDRRS